MLCIVVFFSIYIYIGIIPIYIYMYIIICTILYTICDFGKTKLTIKKYILIITKDTFYRTYIHIIMSIYVN